MTATLDRPILTGQRWTKDDLITRLLELPAEIAEQEQEVLAACHALGGAKERLQLQEDSTLLGFREDGTPWIDGKNEATRAAQLRLRVREEWEAVTAAQAIVDRERITLGLLVNELKALRSVAVLIGGRDE